MYYFYILKKIIGATPFLKKSDLYVSPINKVYNVAQKQ